MLENPGMPGDLQLLAVSSGTFLTSLITTGWLSLNIALNDAGCCQEFEHFAWVACKTLTSHFKYPDFILFYFILFYFILFYFILRNMILFSLVYWSQIIPSCTERNTGKFAYLLAFWQVGLAMRKLKQPVFSQLWGLENC